MVKVKLTDSWVASGTEIADLRQVMNEISDCTKGIDVAVDDIQFVTTTKHPDLENALACIFTGDKNLLSEIAPQKRARPKCRGRILRKEELDSEDFMSLLDETLNQTGLFLRDAAHGKWYFVSMNVLSKLSFYGCGGSFMTKPARELNTKSTVDRNNFAMAALMNSGVDKLKFIVRSCNGFSKVFALTSRKYAVIPQDVLLDIYDQIEKENLLGKTQCKSWKVDHFFTQIAITFPEKGEELRKLYNIPDRRLVPGLVLETSDTGECSVIIRTGWFIGSSYILESEVSRKHIGKVDTKKIIESVNNVFDRYTRLPERLCELMLINITPTNADVSTPAGQIANRKAIDDAVDMIFRDLSISTAITKKSDEELRPLVKAQFSDSVSYSAYDVVVQLFSLGEKLPGLSQMQKKMLEKMIGKMPYLKF